MAHGEKENSESDLKEARMFTLSAESGCINSSARFKEPLQ